MNTYTITIKVTPSPGGFDTSAHVSDPNIQFTEVAGLLKQQGKHFYDTAAKLIDKSPDILKRMETQDFTWDEFVDAISK